MVTKSSAKVGRHEGSSFVFMDPLQRSDREFSDGVSVTGESFTMLYGTGSLCPIPEMIESVDIERTETRMKKLVRSSVLIGITAVVSLSVLIIGCGKRGSEAPTTGYSGGQKAGAVANPPSSAGQPPRGPSGMSSVGLPSTGR